MSRDANRPTLQNPPIPGGISSDPTYHIELIVPSSPVSTPFSLGSDLIMIMQVNKYDKNWKKEWFGAGLFFEGTQQVNVDVFKTLENRKVLSNVEKSGLLSKAEELGLTLSSIEKLGLLSKAEELELLSLFEKAAGFSPAVLAAASLPVLVAAIRTVVLIPDDSTALVATQAVVAGTLVATATGLFVGSILLDGLQEAD